MFRLILALDGKAPLTFNENPLGAEGRMSYDRTLIFASAILTCDECNSRRDSNGGPEGYTKSYWTNISFMSSEKYLSEKSLSLGSSGKMAHSSVSSQMSSYVNVVSRRMMQLDGIK